MVKTRARPNQEGDTMETSRPSASPEAGTGAIWQHCQAARATPPEPIPRDIMRCVASEIDDISEEGKAIVNCIVKAMNHLINKKDEVISCLENKIVKLEDKITKLESQLDDVSQYERRDTVIISGPAMPLEMASENPVDVVIRSIKDNLKINLTQDDINVAHRLGEKKTQNINRPIIVKLMSRQKMFEITDACVKVRPNIYVNESLTPKRRALFKTIWDI